MATLDVVPVYVLRHLASFLDLASLCALSRTARVGRHVAEDELRGVREACACLAQRYPVAYDALMSRVSRRRRRRVPSVARMAARCSRWGVRIGRSPCDALLAHLDGAFCVSADHTVYHDPEAQYCIHRWTIDGRNRPHRNAGLPGQAWTWSGLGSAVSAFRPGVAVSAFRPGVAVRVHMAGYAPAAATATPPPGSSATHTDNTHADTDSTHADTDITHADTDVAFLLPDAPRLILGAKGNNTLVVRIDLEAASATPTDRIAAV